MPLLHIPSSPWLSSPKYRNRLRWSYTHMSHTQEHQPSQMPSFQLSLHEHKCPSPSTHKYIYHTFFIPFFAYNLNIFLCTFHITTQTPSTQPSPHICTQLHTNTHSYTSSFPSEAKKVCAQQILVLSSLVDGIWRSGWIARWTREVLFLAWFLAWWKSPSRTFEIPHRVHSLGL